MPTDYLISVDSPCSGDQTVTQQGTNVYGGGQGDFTYALLNLDPNETRWKFTVYDYERTTACSPSKTFLQDPPGDASDPSGDYSEVGGSGSASVTAQP